MMSPHPPRLRMKRRKTVSVTPAMGARTVAGEIVTGPICRLDGTRFRLAARVAGGGPQLSQNLRIQSHSTPRTQRTTETAAAGIILVEAATKSPRLARASSVLNPRNPRIFAEAKLLLGRLGFRVLAAEAFDATGGVHQLLLS